MKAGALVLGIIGGVIALLYGLVGFGLGSLADLGEAGSGAGLKLLSLGLPIAALFGAGMVISKPIAGSVLMAIGALGFVLILGFNFFTAVPIILLGLGALLGVLGASQPSQRTTQTA